MAKRNIVIDIGNTQLKYGLFENGKLAEQQVVTGASGVMQVIERHKPENAILATVSGKSTEIWQNIKVPGKKLELNWQTPLPIQNNYATPQTLGADRLAGVIGARVLFPNRNCLVIDAGTCITYDFISAHGIYTGGSISPGLQMKFKALHTFTGRLPLIEKLEDVPITGTSSAEAILSGVIHGTVAEIKGIIQEYSQNSVGLVTILCGGDAVFFESKLKGGIFVVPELVLIGLNRILDYNV